MLGALTAAAVLSTALVVVLVWKSPDQQVSRLVRGLAVVIGIGLFIGGGMVAAFGWEGMGGISFLMGGVLAVLGLAVLIISVFRLSSHGQP
jgi:hypothetical protein